MVTCNPLASQGWGVMWDFEGEKNTKEKIINQKVIAKCKLIVKFTG